MGTNLMEIVKNALTAETQEKIAGFLGENSENTSKAIQSAVPAILNGLTGVATDEDKAVNMLGTLKGWISNGDISTDVHSDSDLSSISSKGAEMLGSLLGKDSLDKVNTSVASASGLSSISASSLIGLLSPMVLGWLTKSSEGSSFFSFLTSQSSLLSGVASNVTPNVQDVKETFNAASNMGSEHIANDGITLFKKILPLLIGLLIAGLLFMFFKKGCNKNENCTQANTTMNVDTTTTDSTTVDSFAMAATQKWEATLGKMMEYTLPNGVKISIPENGFENKFFGFMKDEKADLKGSWFELDRILFNTGGSGLNTVSMTQIQTVAEILKAYPTVKVKLGGYTDNTGSVEGNKKLSGERAQSVLSELTKLGIGADRMESEGYGPEHPVCPANDTEDCKAKNRRVAFRVTSK